MKRVYRQNKSSRINSFQFSRPSIPGWPGSRRRLMLLAACALAVMLFGLSCVIVAGGSSAGPAIAQSVRGVEAPPGPAPEPPGLWADSAVLIDQESGRVLYGKAPHGRLPIASTTKIMTALVVRGQLDLEDEVTVTPEAAAVGEQSAGLVAGEKLTVEELLWSLLVHSANDAASALAQYTAGSSQSFARLMNREAARLGARDTHFTNPHGLDETDHYSSAYDLALMARKLLEDPVLARMVKAKSHSISPAPGQTAPRLLTSHNEILTRYRYSTGVKTGYTGKAGLCLVASAAKDGKMLVSTVLNSSHRTDDTIALMEYGFSATERIALTKTGRPVGSSRTSAFPRRHVGVVAKKGLGVLTLKGSGDVFQVRMVYSRRAPADIGKGDALGTVECLVNRKTFERTELVAASSASRAGPISAVAAFLWYALCWMGRLLSAPFRVF